MGNLTDDMTRLRGEVDALRSDRGALMQELARGAKDLASTVSAMQADFAAAHDTMARKTGKARASYVARIKKQVGQMRKENASDLAGASHAWFAF
jgi:outer membrane murein-binding lipoprotein Lpp